jgi:general nucleoside transport system permease protein
MTAEPITPSKSRGSPSSALADAGRSALRIALTTLVPVLLALVLSGGVLLLLGADPFEYFAYVARRGLLTWFGLQETITRMAPLLLLGAGLILAFRAGLWNLGLDGQFLLGAVAASAAAPPLAAALPVPLALAASAVAGMAAAALWSVVPAVLKAWHGVNEIITTLMMSFLGVSLANALVKLVFLDPATTVPQTRTLAVADRLPPLPGTTISSGVLVGLVAIVAAHLVMTRTGFGLKLRVVGANPRAATHVGLPVPVLTVIVFAVSAALVGLAGAVEILGVYGNVRADWNPAFGLAVIPLVFLARLNGFATIVFVLFFSALQIGAESAARRLGVPHYFSLVMVAALLIMLALVEYLTHRWQQRRS